MKETMEVLRKDTVYDEKCPLLFAVSIVGQKWKLPILWFLLEHEVLHYNKLKRYVTGVTNTMLTKSLRELEVDGLVDRTQHPTIPPSVEYRLTQRGTALLPALNELFRWGEDQMLYKGSHPPNAQNVR